MGVVLVLCDYLSLLNASYFLLFWPFSVDWPVVVRCCCRYLSGVVATQFSDCAVLVVWPLLALASCFTAVLCSPFYVQFLGCFVPVYSFGALATPSMLEV